MAGLINLLPYIGDLIQVEDEVAKNCLNAYNRTLDCSEDLQLTRHYYQYSWTKTTLEGLCTSRCSASIETWAHAVEQACDRDDLPFIVAATSYKGSVFTEKVKYGYGMVCLKSTDSGSTNGWCEIEAESWNQHVLDQIAEARESHNNATILRRQMQFVEPSVNECMDACDAGDNDCSSAVNQLNGRSVVADSVSPAPVRRDFQESENTTVPDMQIDIPISGPSQQTTGLLSSYPQWILCSSCFLSRLELQANSYSSNWSPALANDYAELGKICSVNTTKVVRDDTKFIQTTLSMVTPTPTLNVEISICPGETVGFFDEDTPISFSNNNIVSTAELLFLNRMALNETTLWTPLKRLTKKSSLCLPQPCEMIQVDKKDSCQGIIRRTNTTTTLFFSWNPHLIGDCTSGLVSLQNVCVGPPGGRYKLPNPVMGTHPNVRVSSPASSHPTSVTKPFGNYSTTAISLSTTGLSSQTTMQAVHNTSSSFGHNSTLFGYNSSLHTNSSMTANRYVPTKIIED
ncbi:hypothetical protein Dda_7449 [Drechslerella dactyloides]|uniref:Uncharacterized protein n=1 Tax=Drechslerella dactyloides TaxID=74499 RepID=A0AAD6NGT4_DREDA|nr:hypothetical protein Dda_7449 [Drechslerella dactyloides]